MSKYNTVEFHSMLNSENVLVQPVIFQECNIEEMEEEEPPAPSKKDKKSKVVEEKAPSLAFKITSKVAYKTVLKGDPFHNCFFFFLN